MNKINFVIILLLSSLGSVLANVEPVKTEEFSDSVNSVGNKTIIPPRLELDAQITPNSQSEEDAKMLEEYLTPMEFGGYMPAPQGNLATSNRVNKVANATKWEDDQIIVLEGYIVKQVGRRSYLFRDDSGEITLGIDRRAWNKGLFTAQDKVKLIADVDTSWGKIEVEAIRIEPLGEHINLPFNMDKKASHIERTEQ
ncbi:YgiW/YdeI family stress tolerance OB fold protein [Mannheimia massilioguelmaensis]|uniref:YgiW/YdeI family stress tolerance OB fold protein n=1 Tax=Mannheimia massilioguelmaensis TaxID=1604354 RepID=UPI0009E22AF6|nr:NirD/YgiW/YdeI family stress tolerance protein [Mannheimia massilioguelmaensis]